MTAAEYIEELQSERDRLDPLLSSNSIRLLDAEIEKVNAERYGGVVKAERFGVEQKYVPTSAQPELYQEPVIKLVEKIELPIDQHPKFNFVGKILGPKGSTLKNIVSATRAKISVLGRGSTRDSAREEELLASGEPKHQHFGEPLHIMVTIEAPRSEAHERFSQAMEEINKAMAGDMNNNNNGGDAQPPEQQFTGGIPIHGTPIIKVGIPPPGAIVLNDPAAIRSLERGGKLVRETTR